jgi:hypothetical protein
MRRSTARGPQAGCRRVCCEFDDQFFYRRDSPIERRADRRAQPDEPVEVVAKGQGFAGHQQNAPAGSAHDGDEPQHRCRVEFVQRHQQVFGRGIAGG